MQPDSPASIYLELRSNILTKAIDIFKSNPEYQNLGCFGVLMDMGFDGGSATLVALADGTASMYFSSGGAVIGGGTHEQIIFAAQKMSRLAEVYVSEMSTTGSYPLPPAGQVYFYALTPDGVVTFRASEEELGSGKHRLSQLFFAGHEVIAHLRELSEKAENPG